VNEALSVPKTSQTNQFERQITDYEGNSLCAYGQDYGRAFMAFETVTDVSKWSSPVISYTMYCMCTVHIVRHTNKTAEKS
jgi:hypothetical protein